jgi:hypothetical protein
VAKGQNFRDRRSFRVNSGYAQNRGCESHQNQSKCIQRARESRWTYLGEGLTLSITSGVGEEIDCLRLERPCGVDRWSRRTLHSVHCCENTGIGQEQRDLDFIRLNKAWKNDIVCNRLRIGFTLLRSMSRPENSRPS